MDSIPLLIAIVICVLFSGYFSMTETAFTSFSNPRMKNLANDGNKKAQLVLKLNQNYDKLLSTILIGNNIVNIAGASLATTVFVGWVGDMGVGLSTVVMTIVVLIFGEITPKNIAKDYPEKIAMYNAPLLSFFVIIFTPLNYLFSLWKKLVSKLLGSKPNNSITEDEILTIVKDASSEGSIKNEASEFIQTAFDFDDLDVDEVCTPRVDIVAVKDSATKKEIIETFNECGYSRLPVYKETIDDTYGVINFKDFYKQCIVLKKDIDAAISDVKYINPTMKISKLMKLFQKEHHHLAMVVDEFGGISGIITLEDIIEELVGEIYDEHDKIENEDIRELDHNTYLVSGMANLDKLFAVLGIKDEIEDITSVSGFAMDQLGKIPTVGDVFVYLDWKFEILGVTNHRVDEVRITKIIKELDEEED